MGRGGGVPGPMLQAEEQSPAATPCSNMQFYTVVQQASHTLAMYGPVCGKGYLKMRDRESRRRDQSQGPVEFPFPQTVHGERRPKGHRWDSPYSTRMSTPTCSCQKYICPLTAPQLHEPMHISIEHTRTRREKHSHLLTDNLYATIYLYMGLLYGHTAVVYLCPEHTH